MFAIKSESDSRIDRCEDFYKRFKDGFGNIVKAKMEGCANSVQYKLTLINDKEEEMIIEGGLTAGYEGHGSRATARILKDAGFNIEDDFIFNYIAFDISK